ncbi:MAG: 50S ribosomal protein L35 [Acetobacteraceae bacterium]|nr:50S ribosomal protein L35 [Acetobacteraceae bacterium]
MPKMKTHRGAAKRLRFTGGGKVLRRRTCKSHKLEKKRAKRKRRLGQATLIDHADFRRVKRLLPYG